MVGSVTSFGRIKSAPPPANAVALWCVLLSAAGAKKQRLVASKSALPLELAPLGAGKETVGNAYGREELPPLVLASVRELFKTVRKWLGGPTPRPCSL